MIEDFLKKLENYIATYGGNYNQWYAGIAADPKDRLFNGHSVRNGIDPWIHSEAVFSSEIARNIEKMLLAHGFKGAPGGGNDSTCYVYAYKIASHTRQ